jgi:hypothetical protein
VNLNVALVGKLYFLIGIESHDLKIKNNNLDLKMVQSSVFTDISIKANPT